MTENKDRLAVLCYLIEKLSEATSNQIGATSIQKLVYLLNRDVDLGYRYTMYHYGPYCGQLTYDQNMAAQLGLITVEWVDKKGYDIKSIAGNQDLIDKNLSPERKTSIDKIISHFGAFNANELSLIATAYFVKDNENIVSDTQLIDIVSAIKPDYAHIVEGVLKRAGILPLVK
jgi:uncharacterized protein YwgA